MNILNKLFGKNVSSNKQETKSEPPNIENMKAKGDVNGLIKALNYQEDGAYGGVRRDAAQALRDIGSPAIKPLLAALKDRSNASDIVRGTMIDVLANIIGMPAESLIFSLPSLFTKYNL